MLEGGGMIRLKNAKPYRRGRGENRTEVAED